MTYGYGPPRDWSAPEDDRRDDRDQRRGRSDRPDYGTEPPTSRGAPSGGGRRVPQPPPPARHVAPGGGVPPVPPPASAAPMSPAMPRPYSPPPTPRPAPPANAGPPPGYPPMAPPIPTSPPPRVPPPGPGMTGMMPGPGMTGMMRNPGMTGSMRMPPPGRGPGAPGGPGPRARTAAPPVPPGRRPPARTRRPTKRGLPPLPQTKGLSIKEFQGLLRQLPQHRPWMIAIGIIAAVVVLGACGFGSFLLLNDDTETAADVTPTATVPHRNIDTRDADSQPLTAADVFPNPEIPAADPGFPSYKLIGEVQVTNDCSTAGEGQVRTLITASQCSQMIRASFTASDPTYLVTAGVLNMASSDAARTFSAGVSALTADQGNITGYISDPNTALPLGRAAPRVTMEVRGHFLLYTVIVRKDNAAMGADDANGAKVINYDVLTTYLQDTVIEQWSIDKSALQPTTDASPTA